MKIQPIQQNQCYAPCKSQKVNFKGEFPIKKNKDLIYLMKEADIGSVKRFNELLSQIKNIPDNLKFWVEEHDSEYETNGGRDTAISEHYYLYMQEGQNEKTKKTLAYIFEDTPRWARLTEVNMALERFYGDKIPVDSKEKLIKESENSIV